MPVAADVIAGDLVWVTSVVLTLVFLVYSANSLHLIFRARRYRQQDDLPFSGRPTVAIHLPVYNEVYVARRLLESCYQMVERYGKESARIYVIDDSTDETSALVDDFISQHSAQGVEIRAIRRGSRIGFKAGALQRALEESPEKYIAVFDADFVPPPDFLLRTVAHLEKDPAVGFVQTKWSHLDRNYNIITQSLAVGLDAHFLIDQQGRNGSGYLMNFNGSAGVLRASAIRESGGWGSDTLAEDLDLSYRMQLAGFKAVYLADLEVPAELPPTIGGLKRQQGRWARGSIQTAKKLLGRIRRSDDLTFGQKVQASVHLTYYLVHPLMVLSFVLALFAAFFPIEGVQHEVEVSVPTLSTGQLVTKVAWLSVQVAPWSVFAALLALSTLAAFSYCLEGIRASDAGALSKLKQVTMLVVLGYGVSISNSVQVLKGLFSKDAGTFLRTPKYSITKAKEDWKGKKYQLPFTLTALMEASAAAVGALALVRAYLAGNAGMIPVVSTYLVGYSLVLYLTVRQSMGRPGRADI